MVDQHAVAGAERRGERAQAEVADAVVRDVVDRSVEQTISGALAFHSTAVYHVVHETRTSIHRRAQPARAGLRLPRRDGQPRAVHQPHAQALGVLRPRPRDRLQGARAGQRRRQDRDRRDRGCLGAAPAADRRAQRRRSAGAASATAPTRSRSSPSGGTRINFEYAWQQAPLSERLAAPIVRGILRRGNERAMQRLAEQLQAA